MVGFHRTNETDVIHATGDVRKEIGDLCSAFSAWRGLPLALKQSVFSVELFEFRFWIEGIDMRDAAGHEHKDDAFCPGGEVGHFRSKRIDLTYRRIGASTEFIEDPGKEQRSTDQRSQR